MLLSDFIEVIIGLDSDVYRVSEESGWIEVCVSVHNVQSNCPITFSLPIEISNSANSAGALSFVF